MLEPISMRIEFVLPAERELQSVLALRETVNAEPFAGFKARSLVMRYVLIERDTNRLTLCIEPATPADSSPADWGRIWGVPIVPMPASGQGRTGTGHTP